MNILIQFFYVVLYQPLFNALMLLYWYLPGRDLGLAIIALTLLIKLALHPSSKKALRSQKALAELQPKIKTLQAQHSNDKERQMKEVFELYQREKVSPASGCLPLLVQLPILIALYQVFIKGFSPGILEQYLYDFMPRIGPVSEKIFGLINLAGNKFSWGLAILVVLSGVLQFWQTKMTMAKSGRQPIGGVGVKDFAATMQKQMMYFLPIITMIIVWQFGAVIGVYWVASTLFTIIEQQIIFSPKTKS